ncbi:MAG: SOS response-associated peptidase [Sedimentisphaerales bacterium]|nr:SOS response-associated peptidase [Sedimentisphaerales bacterium]
MCGRFALTISPEALAKLFDLADALDDLKRGGWEADDLQPRYNIAPSQSVAAVVGGEDEQGRILKKLRWGLIPAWAKDPAIGARLINARSETVAEKPAFKSAFRKRRCLIPADGFFEWQRLSGGRQIADGWRVSGKQPYFIRLRDESPMAMAGLWESWQGADGAVIESCAILTTRCNELMEPIHNRMPVIIGRGDFGLWLGRADVKAGSLKDLMNPLPSEQLLAYPVSPVVNNPRNNTAECLEPA